MGSQDDLKILLSASLNTGKSLGDINSAISGLEKRVNKLKLKIEIPQNFGTNISSFISAVNKMKTIADDQNKVIREEIQELTKLDGTIEKVTTQYLKNGEVIEKSRTKIDQRKESIKQETKVLDDQRKTLEDLIAENERYSKDVQSQTRYNSNGEVIGATHTIQDSENNNRLVVNTDADGLITNYKEIEASLKNVQQEEKELLRLRQEAEAAEKQFVLAVQENEKKTLDFQQSVQDRQAKINDLMRRFGADGNVAKQLKEVNDELSKINFSGNNGLTGVAGSYKAALRDVDIGLKKVSASAATATSHTLSMSEGLKTAFQKFPIWMIATTAFYAPLRSLEQGVQYVYDLDTALTDLTKTSDLTQAGFAEFAKQATETANSVGALTLDVVKSTTEWTRLGYSIQQAQQLAKETVIYQNVGDIANAQDASTDLIAAIKGFGIEVDNNGKNVQHLVDVYNEVGNKFAISSAGIGEAAKRSASALSAAGNTLEQSVALITAANSSVQDPEKVGNALKTLSLRLRGISDDGEDVSNLIPTLEKQFNGLGLSLKNSDDSFKSTYEIFKELAGVWDKLSDFQQSNILELVAGKEQANIAASLLANWQDAEGALQAGINSFNSAAIENQKYLDSLQGHVAKFKNAMNAIWSDNVASDSLKQLVDIGTGAIGMLSDLTHTFGLLGTSVGIASVATLAFNKNIRTSALSMFAIDLKAVNLAVKLYTGSTVAARLATIALQATMTLGLSVAIAGVVAGISSLISHHQKLKQEQQEYQQQQQTIADNYTNQKDKIEELASTYDALSVATKNGTQFFDADQEQRYKDTVQQLSELLPSVVSSIDDKGQAHLKNVDAIKQEIEYAKKLSDQEQKQSVLDAKDNFGDQLKQLKKDQKEVEDIRSKILFGGNIVTSGGFATFIKYSDSELNQLQTKLLQAENKVATSSNGIRDNLNQIASSILNVNKVKLDDNLTTQLDKLTSSLGLDGLSSDELVDKANAVATFFTKLNSLKNNGDQGAVAKLTGDIQNLGKSIGLTDVQISTYIDSLNNADESQNQTQQSTLNLSDAQEKLQSAFKDASDAIAPLNQALADIADGQSLTANTVADLIVKYPELASHLIKTADGWTIEKNAIEARRQAAIQNQEDSLKAEAGITDAVLAQLKDRLKAYGIELETIQTLADARLAAADKLTPKGLPEDRGNYKQAKEDLLAYGSIIEQINALDKLMNDRSLGVSKSKSSTKQGPELNDAIEEQDLTKELINSFNAEYEAREKNIDAIDRKIKLAEKQGDEARQAELTTKKIEEETKALEALNDAQAKIHDEANNIRSQRPDLNTDSWFDVNGEASQAYKEYLNSFAKRSEDIRNNTKLSVKERNKELDALKQEQKQVEDMFNSLYQLKHAWSDNTEEAQKLGDAIDQDVDTLKQKTLDAAQAIIDAQNEIDQTVIDSYQEQIDNLQKQWAEQDTAEERAKRQAEIAKLNNQLAVIQAGNLGNISDELAKQLGLEDAKAEYLQKQNDLIEEQQKLQNIQNEKNVRLFQNGKFEWVADPRKVKEEQDNLANMQDDFNQWQKDQLSSIQDDLKSKVEDYNDWELQQTRNNLIAELQAKIDAKQKEIEQRNKDFEEEKKAWEQQGIDLNGTLSSTMDTLNQTYGDKWDGILEILRGKLKDAQDLYAQIVGMSTVSVPSSSPTSSNSASSNSAEPEKSNQRKYLDGLIANGNDGQKKWAENQIKLGQFHTGLQEGLVGDDKTSISSILSRLGVKQNEQLVKLLNGEMVVKNPITMLENIVGSFKGMANMLSITPKVAAASAGGDTYQINIDRVVTPDAKTFMSNLKLYAKNN